MKKILMLCACATLMLAACDQKKDTDHADIQNPVITPDNVTAIAHPGQIDKARGEQQQAQEQAAQNAPERHMVGGAMVNTPVPDSAPSVTNTPAPTVAEATAQAGASASTCGADQSWVGQPLKSVDLSKIKGVVRTIYPDQPVTMDYSDQRLNIIIERGTDKILEVKCG